MKILGCLDLQGNLLERGRGYKVIVEILGIEQEKEEG